MNISDLTDIFFLKSLKIEKVAKKLGVPFYLVFYVLLIEDKRFFYHFGLDFIGVIRAFLVNKKAKRRKQGASTITQQIYDIKQEKKNFKRERSYKRKVRQILYSLKIEVEKDKFKILDYYIKNVYFGRNYYGISKASQGYFNKNIKNINKAEAFFLVERIASPNKVRISRVKGILKRNKVYKSLNGKELEELKKIYEKFEKGELWQKNNTKLG